VPGSTHYQLIEPLPPAVLLFAGDAPRSRATTCWRPVLGVAHCGCPPALDTTWNRRFSGGTKVPGVLEPVPGSSTLIPMGGWYGISVPNTREYGRATPQRAGTARARTSETTQLPEGGRGEGRGRGRCRELTKGLLMGGTYPAPDPQRPGALQPGAAHLSLARPLGVQRQTASTSERTSRVTLGE
jgi:hypothetical protein